LATVKANGRKLGFGFAAKLGLGVLVGAVIWPESPQLAKSAIERGRASRTAGIAASLLWMREWKGRIAKDVTTLRAGTAGRQTIDANLPAQREKNPSVPSEFWDRIAAKARADIGGLVDSLGPIYEKRFTKVELEQLLTFYRSPVGRHILAEQGSIAQESQ
jgi:hypothetical protein